MSANASVVITGGSTGIGRACVTRVLETGTPVFNLDVNPSEPLPGETFVETDLCDATAIEAAFRRITKDAVIVGLVNNAGSAVAHSLAETEPDDFARLVPLNLVAPALCARLAAESMTKAGWGRIVNISSRAALGKELRTAYAATKGGIAAMTRVWALELAASGITVNTVGPGPIATELFRKVNPEDSPKTRQIIDSIPVRRLGTPEDIANAVMFFLRKETGFVTGQTLYACGGLSVGLVS